MKKTGNDKTISDLRKKAEDLLKLKKKSSSWSLKEADMLKLIHELEVHQVELEIVNEELRRSQNMAEQSADKYMELYDFAPVGYLSLTKNGQIDGLNLQAASLLKKERSFLINKELRQYISVDSRDSFDACYKRIFSRKIKETCEISLISAEKDPVYLFMSAIWKEDIGMVLITISDITFRKLAEMEIKEKVKDLERFYNIAVGRELKMIELKKTINELLVRLGEKKQFRIPE